ncbi:MAG: hypothetical protein IPJ65_36075 [Archangiaceae bacterium]|nr:hypothetical protein [Archangiaceae bacterium]
MPRRLPHPLLALLSLIALALGWAACAGSEPYVQRACVKTLCDFGGSWNVDYALTEGDAGVACAPTAAPLTLSLYGDAVCLNGADTGGGDGGCNVWFGVARTATGGSGREQWALQEDDAGALSGTWSVDMPECSARYAVHGTR